MKVRKKDTIHGHRNLIHMCLMSYSSVNGPFSTAHCELE